MLRVTEKIVKLKFKIIFILIKISTFNISGSLKNINFKQVENKLRLMPPNFFEIPTIYTFESKNYFINVCKFPRIVKYA